MESTKTNSIKAKGLDHSLVEKKQKERFLCDAREPNNTIRNEETNRRMNGTCCQARSTKRRSVELTIPNTHMQHKCPCVYPENCQQMYQMVLSFRYISLVTFSSICFAFFLGVIARKLLSASLATSLSHQSIPDSVFNYDRTLVDIVEAENIINGHSLPTIYTTKNFDTSTSITTSVFFNRKNEAEKKPVPFKDEEHVHHGQQRDHTNPVAHHLLMDLDNIDAEFLKSEKRLAVATLELLNETGLPVLSYHCHEIQQKSQTIKCAFMLLKGHVVIHTWPNHGVMHVDLFSAGPKNMGQFVSLAETIFTDGMATRNQSCSTDQPSSQTLANNKSVGDVKNHLAQEHSEVLLSPSLQIQTPRMLNWSIKRRGSPPGESAKGNTDADHMRHHQYNHVLGSSRFSMKKYIASSQTEFYHIEIYDVIDPLTQSYEGYKKAFLSTMPSSPSYESQHKELYQPDRIVITDGVVSSRKVGEAAYHEALVHPAMLTGDGPEIVAIIGGGLGATLREVLKHRSVEKVIMIEMNQGWGNISTEFLPTFSDCGDLIGRANNCFNDPIVEMYYEDAIEWFIRNYASKEGGNAGGDFNLFFDVIIMDAPTPDNEPIVSARFANALSNALSEEGVFVVQTDEEVHLGEPSEIDKYHQHERRSFQSILESIDVSDNGGFDAIFQYGEYHGGLLIDSIWSYTIAFKSPSAKQYWHANEAEVNLEIHSRTVRTKSGIVPYHYFDGATMQTYKYPSRSVEEVFCRSTGNTNPICRSGPGFDPEKKNIPISSLEVKTSTMPNSGRGVFAKVDIEKGSYIAIEECIHNMHASDSTVQLVEELFDEDLGWQFETLYYYTAGYGFSNLYYGEQAMDVDPGIVTFMNHGCNGTYNVGSFGGQLTELSPTTDIIQSLKYQPFNPSLDRKIRVHYCASDVARRDIRAGEEMFTNYITYSTTGEEEEYIRSLYKMCTDQLQVGLISQYERGLSESAEFTGTSKSKSHNNSSFKEHQERRNTSDIFTHNEYRSDRSATVSTTAGNI